MNFTNRGFFYVMLTFVGILLVAYICINDVDLTAHRLINNRSAESLGLPILSGSQDSREREGNFYVNGPMPENFNLEKERKKHPLDYINTGGKPGEEFVQIVTRSLPNKERFPDFKWGQTK